MSAKIPMFKSGQPDKGPSSFPPLAVPEMANETNWQETEHLLRRGMDGCFDCIQILDLEGRMLWMNQGGRRGMEITDFTAYQHSSWLKLWSPADRSAAQTATATAIATGEATFTGSHPATNGGCDQWDVGLTLIRDKTGRPEKIFVVAHNVTERREAESVVRDQATRWQAIVKAESQSVKVIGLDGRLIEINPAGVAMLGAVSIDEAKRQPLLEYMSPKYRKPFHELLEQVRRGMEGNLQYEIITLRGSHRWIETHLTPLRNSTGKIYALLALSRDITSTREMESRPFHAQRLEAIGMLSTGIAHDLNNVLTPVQMAVTLLSEHVPNNEARALLEMIGKSVTRGAGLVRQILAFAHRAAPQSQSHQLKHIVGDLITVIQETFPKSIKFESYLPPDLWKVEGDPLQIHQVLLNLSINARDAMPDGGSLRLTAENQVLDEIAAGAFPKGRPGSFVLLKVEDSGTGIPPEILARIWEPFYTTKGPERGTGLGLPTVRGIVEHHDGFLSLETSPGLGSTFRIWLPASQNHLETDCIPVVSPRPPPGNGELILIVEDEPSIRELANQALTRQGYRVLCANDGIEAMGLFTRNHHEIVLLITDLNMPKLDGRSLIKRVRDLRPAIKILAISGSGEAPGLEGEKGSQKTAFIGKPFELEHFLSEVDRLLKITSGAE